MKSASFFATLAIAIAVGLAAAAPSLAQDAPSKDQMLKALKKPATRSLVITDPAKEKKEQELIKTLQTRGTRAITVEERAQVAEIVKEKPALDLEIFFAYNSDVIQQESVPSLMNLGKALIDGELKDTVFLVGGHTDATGSDIYNLDLSQRRANSVKGFLMQNFKIAPDRLVATGFGEEQLKDPADPAGGINRRVQIVNLASVKQAGK
ncbi:MAG: OmpA family protein [Hyphomicrobiales bacterium]